MGVPDIYFWKIFKKYISYNVQGYLHNRMEECQYVDQFSKLRMRALF